MLLRQQQQQQQQHLHSAGQDVPGSSGFQSPASSTLDLQAAAAAHSGGFADPSWDLGPPDIKLTEPVSTPSKGSGDHQQGDSSKPVLSRVESLSSSLNDFDAKRIHEAVEGMGSGRVSRAQSEGEQHMLPTQQQQGGDAIDFPIPLAQATPQDLRAFGLDKQSHATSSQAMDSSRRQAMIQVCAYVCACERDLRALGWTTMRACMCV